MCTLIILWKHHPAAPLVLALNRDEFLARPAEPIARWRPGGDFPKGEIISGRDLQSGGTWFAVGPRMVSALTNHRSAERSRPGRLTRGDLVVRAALAGNAEEADRMMRDAAAADYGPFHLMATDGERMMWWTNRGGSLEAHEVEPGLHVLGNYGMDNDQDPVVAALLARLDGIGSEPEDAMRDRLREALALHGTGCPCVHFGPYGTRGSALLSWGGADPKLEFTDGPPCESAWVRWEGDLG